MQTEIKTLPIPALADSVAAGFLIAFLVMSIQTDKDKAKREKACNARVELVKIISSVIVATEIISKVTAAAETIKQIGIDIAAMINGKGHNDTDSPLEYVTDNERKKLDELIARYYEVDKFVPGAEDMKKELRDKILVQTCSTLNGAAPIRDRIPDYDKLVELFCRSFPPA